MAAGTRRVFLPTSSLGIAKPFADMMKFWRTYSSPHHRGCCIGLCKLGARRYLVISIAMIAAIVKKDAAGRVAEARVAVGSCSAAAQRLTALEQALLGSPAHSGLGAMVLQEHLASLSPIDDVRATAAYRNDAALTLIGRALDACVESR